jgi:hypothetical protein
MLGGIGTLLTLLALWGLHWVEGWMLEEQRASLELTLEPDDPPMPFIVEQLKREGFYSKIDVVEIESDGRRHLGLELSWRARSRTPQTPSFLTQLQGTPGVVSVKWMARAAPPV